MLNPTARELVEARHALEERAASLLGRIIFSFSRLDMNLGLTIVGLRHCALAPGNVDDVEPMNVHSRLQALETYISGSSDLVEAAKDELTRWSASAHSVRVKRNALIHGRWAADPIKNKALNIVGLPTSQTQSTTEYSIEELEQFNEEIKLLAVKLSKLRERWKLP